MNPRITMAGTASGVGKTTITIGILAALTDLGYQVQPFKVGPDYIDPGFHSLVTGRKSRNLDSYFMDSETLKEVFLNAAGRAELSVIEGVMGLYDGKKGLEMEGSTAGIARTLDSPVILVLDAGKMAQSAAALVAGYKNFDPELRLEGVILNNIGSSGHYAMIREIMEDRLEIRVLGYLPRNEKLVLPERHLGLVPVTESGELAEFVSHLKELVKDHIDLEGILSLARRTEPLSSTGRNIFNRVSQLQQEKKQQEGKQEWENQKENEASGKNIQVSLGVPYDEAFNFYYQDNLDILEGYGAQLEYFSPLQDERLPEVDGLYLGGGFPENFLAELAANRSLKEEILEKAREGLPIYAECGGLIYLAREVSNFKGENFPLVGLIPGKVVMGDSLQAMGYVRAEVRRDNLLSRAGDEIKGHEFHYSRLIDLPEGVEYCYKLYGGRNSEGRKGGIIVENTLASYLHLHFASNLNLAERLLQHCQDFKNYQK